MGSRRAAITWVRDELPTLLHNGRIDEPAHFCALVLASYANNDGTNIWASEDTIARRIKRSLRETRDILERLTAAGVVRQETADNGASGWAITFTCAVSESDVVDAREATKRAQSRARKAKQRAGKKRAAEQEPPTDVTQECHAPAEGVTQECHASHAQVSRSQPNVTQECHAQSVTESVTLAGQDGSTSLDLPKEDLPTTTSPAPPARVGRDDFIESAGNDVKQGTLLQFPEPPPKFDSEEEFMRWYAKYPRKESRKPALKFWPAAVRDAGVDALHAALEVHVERWRYLRTPADKIPLPSTWLNQERWKDQITDPRPRASGEHQPYHSSQSNYSRMGRFTKK